MINDGGFTGFHFGILDDRGEVKEIKPFNQAESDLAEGIVFMGNNNETERHYIADESLGGIEREYTETNRKADVGDYVFVKEYAGETECNYAKADRFDEYGDLISYSHIFGIRYDLSPTDNEDVFCTLSPTDIIRHNGERYRLVDRKAEVGDKVLYMFEGKSDGTVVTATHIASDSIDIEEYEDDVGTVFGYYHDGYAVLEPVIDEQETDAPTEPQPDLVDLVIRLTRKVAELEKTANNADYKAGQALTTAELQAEKLRDFLETPTPYAEQSELIEINGDIRRIEEALAWRKSNRRLF